jgi:hypothetical protein
MRRENRRAQGRENAIPQPALEFQHERGQLQHHRNYDPITTASESGLVATAGQPYV